MRPTPIAAFSLLALAAPGALGQKIADYDFSESVTFVSDSAPVEIPSLDFRLTSDANNEVSHLPATHSLGDEQLVLASGQTGSVDLGPSLDPTDFA